MLRSILHVHADEEEPLRIGLQLEVHITLQNQPQTNPKSLSLTNERHPRKKGSRSRRHVHYLGAGRRTGGPTLCPGTTPMADIFSAYTSFVRCRSPSVHASGPEATTLCIL